MYRGFIVIEIPTKILDLKLHLKIHNLYLLHYTYKSTGYVWKGSSYHSKPNRTMKMIP